MAGGVPITVTHSKSRPVLAANQLNTFVPALDLRPKAGAPSRDNSRGEDARCMKANVSLPRMRDRRTTARPPSGSRRGD